MGPRVLITGWFSFEEVVATIGDQAGAEAMRERLTAAGARCDVALAPYLGAGVDWRTVDPNDYELLVFTTGPLTDDPLIGTLLDRFAGCRRWAVNVSVISEAMRARFDRVWPRDHGTETVRPDLAFAGDGRLRPVLAVTYTPVQPEYQHGRHEQVSRTVREWLEARQHSAIELDMDLYAHGRYPRAAQQVESIIARCDVVVSMRLHGSVFALKHGRPVIALDPVATGGKVQRQMDCVGWPCVLLPERVSAATLDDALAFCLSDQARARAAGSRDAATRSVQAVLDEIAGALVR